jgi:hypothetical protein
LALGPAIDPPYGTALLIPHWTTEFPAIFTAQPMPILPAILYSDGPTVCATI